MNWYIGIGIIFLLSACFNAWKDQAIKAEKAIAESSRSEARKAARNKLSEYLLQMEERISAFVSLGADHFNRNMKQKDERFYRVLENVEHVMSTEFDLAEANLFKTRIGFPKAGVQASNSSRKAFAAETDMMRQKAKYLKQFLQVH
ncbi:MAG: hypothetical protein WDM96_03355 [Lacunisphaera sp.]